MDWDLLTGLLLTAVLVLAVAYVVRELAGESLLSFFSEHTARTSEDPNKRLIGQTGEVVTGGADGAMRVRIGIERWQARTPPEAGALAPGTAVRVAGVDGTVLLVEPSAD